MGTDAEDKRTAQNDWYGTGPEDTATLQIAIGIAGQLLMAEAWPRWRSDRACASCCSLQGVDDGGESKLRGCPRRVWGPCCCYVTSVIQSRSVLVTCGVVEWSEQSAKAWNAWTAASMDELAFIHFHELSRSQPAREALFSNRFKNTAALSCCCRLVRRYGNLTCQESRTGAFGLPVSACCSAAKKAFWLVLLVASTVPSRPSPPPGNKS